MEKREREQVESVCWNNAGNPISRDYFRITEHSIINKATNKLHEAASIFLHTPTNFNAGAQERRKWDMMDFSSFPLYMQYYTPLTLDSSYGV